MAPNLNELSDAEYTDVIAGIGGRTLPQNNYFANYDRGVYKRQFNANQQVTPSDAIESLKTAIGVDGISDDVFQVVCREHAPTHLKFIKVEVDDLFPTSSKFSTHSDFITEQILRDSYVSQLSRIEGVDVYDTLYNTTISTTKRAFHTMADFKCFLKDHPALAAVVKRNTNNTDVINYTPVNNFPQYNYKSITIGGTPISDINADSFGNIEINISPATRGRIICFSVDLFGPDSQFKYDIGKFHPYNSEFDKELHTPRFTARLREEAVKNYGVSRAYFNGKLKDAGKVFADQMGASYIAYTACAPNHRGVSFDEFENSHAMKIF